METQIGQFIAAPGGMIAMAGSVAFLGVIAALAHCFMGYLLFRLALVLDGAIAGVWLSGMMLAAWRNNPSSMDFVVAGIIGGILMAMLAWYLYRLAFAAGGAYLALLLVLTAFGQTPPTLAWVLGIIAAIAAAIMCFVYLRKFVIYVSAIGGAIAAVICCLDWWFGLSGHPYDWLPNHPITGIASVLVAGLLAAAGIYVQTASPFFMAARFSPDAKAYKSKRAGNISLRVVK